MTKRFSNTRRNFLKQTSGIMIAIPLATSIAGCSADDANVSVEVAESLPPLKLLETAFVKINSDNSITFLTPAAEFGNGSYQALPVIMAEEMDVDWEQVSIEFSPASDELYAHPRPYFWSIMLTIASSSVEAWYNTLRMAGAQVRRVLMQAAAQSMQVDISELTTEPSKVVHIASGRTMTYGEVAAIAEFDGTLPKLRLAELKNPNDFRLIGNPDMKRIDTPFKVKGEGIYSIDVRRPGMLYATVKRAAFANRTPIRMNRDEILNLKDVVAINDVPGNGVAVVARTYEAAFKADQMLQIEWSDEAQDARYNSSNALSELSEIAADLSREGLNVPDAFGMPKDEGVDKLFEDATNIFERAYTSRFMYHAQLEPLNSVAEISEDGQSIDVWVGTQAPTHCVRSVATALGIPETNVNLHRTFLGGAFGRRAAQDQEWAVDAAILSQIHKAPIKCIWTRESDLQAGRFRPITAQHIRAAISEDGLIQAYHQRTAADEGLRYADPFRYNKGNKFPTISGITLLDKRYDYQGYKAEFIEVRSDVRVSPMRGIGHLSTDFARESFIDEVAHDQGKDPMDFRHDMLANSELGREVIRNLREMTNWDGRPGLGMAMAHETQGLAAQIGLNRDSGEITVEKIWAVYLTGVVVQPDNAMNQLEGNLNFHIGGSLLEEITFTNGKIDQTNLNDYYLPRQYDSPEIEIRLLASDRKPAGLGDAGNETLSAAIANALYSLTKTRVRTVPLSPSVVKEALERT